MKVRERGGRERKKGEKETTWRHGPVVALSALEVVIVGEPSKRVFGLEDLHDLQGVGRHDLQQLRAPMGMRN